jgi:S1-C subfamily serine protease
LYSKTAAAKVTVMTKPKIFSKRVSPVVTAAIAVLLVLGLGALALQFRSPAKPALTNADVQKTAKAAVDSALKKAAGAPAKSALIYNKIAPSIVTIESIGVADANDPNAITAPDGISLGTGVVVNANGDILTANHVVADATSIRVTFADGTEADAAIESSEPENDIAVLTTNAKPGVIVPAVLGGGVQIGDETYAVGNPLGLVSSLSAGVVSGLNRSIPISRDGDDEAMLEGLIQFDAAVNPGNSGGPLLNRSGQVVGIVTALANPSKQGFFVGIGFAVPINVAGGAAGGPPQ